MSASGLPTARTSTNTCSILSRVLSLLGWNLLPLVGFIGAITYGRIALRQLRLPGNTQDGHGLARAGIWISWISLVLLALVIALLMPALSGPVSINLPTA